MIKVSVIIPYFQRDRGILRRALGSVLKQRLSPDRAVELIVVDDGSPVPAQSETEGLVMPPAFHLIVIPQANGGVASARNAGLKAVSVDTKYIAFLDSDDSWHEEHLEQGIQALENGNDFYFCDNRRDDHHASYFQGCSVMKKYIADYTPVNGLISLTGDEIGTSILREFSTQASAVIYRRGIAPHLLFDTAFVKAGEDILFLMQLASKINKGCFSTRIMVNCGRGINLYFSHISWDSPGHLIQEITRMKAHCAIKNKVRLSLENDRWNDKYIQGIKRKIAFLSLRQFIKTRGKWPVEIKALGREDRNFFSWFPLSLFQAGAGKALGLYRPT